MKFYGFFSSVGSNFQDHINKEGISASQFKIGVLRTLIGLDTMVIKYTYGKSTHLCVCVYLEKSCKGRRSEIICCAANMGVG